MTDVRRTIAAELLTIGAVQLRPDEPFTWASGIRAPIYTDNRLTLGYPSLRRSLSHAFSELIRAHALRADLVAGTATAGIPHAAWLADRLDLPMVYVRGKAKEHGKGNQIEGPFQPGQHAVIVEDLISTGGSSLAAVEALRAVGVEGDAVLAIFTYNMKKAREAFDAAGISVFTITDFDALVDVATETKRLSPTQRTALLSWRDEVGGGTYAAG